MGYKRKTFKIGNTLQVFRLGTTVNKKIANGGKKIVQTYIFSKAQFDYVKDSVFNGTICTMKEFFKLDKDNCFDCPFSGNAGNGRCYTHKHYQYYGLIQILRSLVKEYDSFDNIPNYSIDLGLEILDLSKNRYVRFGTYGEPTMHPIQLVQGIANVAETFTGYTHQYAKNKTYNMWFMASTHNEIQAKIAKEKYGYRSFIIVKDNKGINAVICPASKESKKETNCSKCSLCSGIIGKGKKDVVIIEH